MNKQLVIYGMGETAEIMADYFMRDSDYEVVGFTVDSEFNTAKRLMGKPVIDFEVVEQRFPPDEFYLFAAASFGKLNRIRTSMYKKAKDKGYHCPSFVSSRAFVWHNVELGENVFIFENNVVQYKAKIGNNVILWSGNHIGHQTVIEDNCFISSHVVIPGFCKIEKNAFLGINTSFNDGVIFGKDGVTSIGTSVMKDTKPGLIYFGNPARGVRSSIEEYNISEDEI